MKVERFYDVLCENCYSHLSTDYNTGFADSRDEAILWAKNKGFKDYKGKTLCPNCMKIVKALSNIRKKEH